MELEGKTVLITPEMAEEFLTHNIRNRNIRLPYVDELATYMRGGLSSEVQRFVEKEFKRRFPAQAFARATI